MLFFRLTPALLPAPGHSYIIYILMKQFITTLALMVLIFSGIMAQEEKSVFQQYLLPKANDSMQID